MSDYVIYEDSDEEAAGDQQSSEDELDILLHGTPDRKRKLTRSLSRGSLQLSSSEDEFEKEMEKELNETMKQYEQIQLSKLKVSGCKPGCSKPDQTENETGENCYDDIYFDSDEEDVTGKGKTKHKVLTNDELMYDPNIDDDNQQWIDKQRKMYHPNNHASGSGPSSSHSSTSVIHSKQPLSDAVLNCPACMTTLCIDCQRHEKYHHQFRAMFVVNCNIIHSEILRYKPNVKKQQRHRKKRKSTDEQNDAGSCTVAEEVFHPVRCSTCKTEVAMYDKEEVYHFFNVLSSVA